MACASACRALAACSVRRNDAGRFTGSLNQPMRQTQLRAQRALAPLHLALVGFVVVSGQMQQPVQHQHLHLRRERVAAARQLARAVVHADARSPATLPRQTGSRRGKRKHVRRLVLSAKSPIQIAGSRHRSSAAPSPAPRNLTAACASRRKRSSARVEGTRESVVTFAVRTCLTVSQPCLRSVRRARIGLQIWVEKDHRARSRCWSRLRVQFDSTRTAIYCGLPAAPQVPRAASARRLSFTACFAHAQRQLLLLRLGRSRRRAQSAAPARDAPRRHPRSGRS